jgi:hypothetical protein
MLNAYQKQTNNQLHQGGCTEKFIEIEEVDCISMEKLLFLFGSCIHPRFDIYVAWLIRAILGVSVTRIKITQCCKKIGYYLLAYCVLM